MSSSSRTEYHLLISNRSHLSSSRGESHCRWRHANNLNRRKCPQLLRKSSDFPRIFHPLIKIRHTCQQKSSVSWKWNTREYSMRPELKERLPFLPTLSLSSAGPQLGVQWSQNPTSGLIFTSSKLFLDLKAQPLTPPDMYSTHPSLVPPTHQPTNSPTKPPPLPPTPPSPTHQPPPPPPPRPTSAP
jgi:hypothetical protein